VDTAETSSEAKGQGAHGRVRYAAQIGVGVLLFGLVAYAVARDWQEVRDTVGRLSAGELALAELLAVCGLGTSVLVWRQSLAELGSGVRVLAAAKIYLVGQLGKYVPGSFWAFVIQMELAQRVGAPRPRALAASIVAFCINLVTGLGVGILVVPSYADGEWWRYFVVCAFTVVVAAALSPPILTRLIDFGLRMIRRPQLERPVNWHGILAGAAWSVAGWLLYGLSVWVVAVGAGAPAGESLLLCLGGTALAMNAGVLVFIAPSGIGVREAVLVAALSPVLDSGEALSVALVVRLVFTLADLIAAAAALPIRLRARPETMAA
jgi:uncharacterized membrane protein YbhN (UPF0104 family)